MVEPYGNHSSKFDERTQLIRMGSKTRDRALRVFPKCLVVCLMRGFPERLLLMSNVDANHSLI